LRILSLLAEMNPTGTHRVKTAEDAENVKVRKKKK
jgi:hypothetical protein